MAKWGLSNSRLEAWEFGRGWQLEKFTLEMVEPRFMPLLGYVEAWSPSTPGEVIAPVSFVAGKPAADVAALQLKGAAVLQAAAVTNFIATDRVQPARQPDQPAAPAAGAPTGRGGEGARGGGGGRGGRGAAAEPGALTVDQAIRAGGAAVLLKPSRGMHGTVFLAGGRDNPQDQLPKIMLAGEHYNMIARMVQRGIPVKVRVNVQTRFLEQDRNSYNVLAEIPGTDPALRDQVVMLGAHLDSWHTGQGATDNADGSVVVMEAFRILKTTRAAAQADVARRALERRGAGTPRRPRLGAPARAGRGRHTAIGKRSPSTSTSIRARARSTAGISRTTTTRGRSSTPGWRRSRTSAT